MSDDNYYVMECVGDGNYEKITIGLTLEKARSYLEDYRKRRHDTPRTYFSIYKYIEQ